MGDLIVSTPPKKIPGPGLLSLLWNTNKFRKDPYLFGNELVEKYGTIMKINIGPYKVIGLNDPKYHHWVLKENFENYPKGKAFEKLEPLMGQGLLMAPQEFWRQNRGIVQPSFRLNKMSSYHQDILSSTETLFQKWAGSGSVRRNFHADMMELALSVISKSLFDVDYGSKSGEISKAIHDFMAGMEDQVFHLFGFQKYIPTARNLRFLRSVKYLDQLAYELIKKRRANFQDKNDLISMLMNAQLKEGAQGITDKYLRDEVLNFFIGGHETSANALTFTLYNLLLNPDVMEKVRAEIQALCGNKNPTYEELEKFEYLDKVINESLRTFPPIWILSREAKKDDEIDGYHIPKGCIVVVAPYFLHHRKDIWPEPYRFNPERFTPEKIQERPKNSFNPFGLGPRSCIGEFFARMEIKTFLIMALQRYNFELDKSVPIVPLPTITLRPKHGMFVHITERKA